MKNKLKYIIPSVVTFIILGVIFYINKLYPFGDRPLLQNDADYIYVPILYKIWDLLHHGGSIFYTDMGIGNSLYGSLIVQGSLYSPLNLLLYLVKRENIVNFFGLFIIIKLCLVSLTSYIYIEKKYTKVDYFYKILFSVLYTFSGFFLLNYFNAIWLDITILFPILLLYLDRVLENKSEAGYIVLLAISFIITFYFSYFIVIFILLYSAVNIYFDSRKDKKEVIFKLGKGTLIAFLISAFSSLPLIYQILVSSRFGSGVDITLFDNIALKSLYWLFSPLFIILFLKLVCKYKSFGRNKAGYKYITLIILYLIPLVFEPVNMLMHGGSYWCFPCRYGYIVTFILMDAALYYISKYDKTNEVFKKDYMIYFMVIVILLGIEMFLNVKYVDDIIRGDSGILLWLKDMEVYKYIIYIIVPIFICYFVALLFKHKYLRYFILSIVSLYAVFLFSAITLYYNSKYYLSADAEVIHDNMKLPNDGRYKVEYEAYGPNYGHILQVDSLDNWLHLVTSGEVSMFENMGYYLVDDRTYSHGGTIFTDWLLNLKYMFTTDYKEDDMFTIIDDMKNKKLYRFNYSSNNGLLVDKIDNVDEDNRFEYQNILYNKLFNNDKKLIQYDHYSFETIDYVEFNYDISGDGYLYFHGYNEDDMDNIDCVIVNDNYVYSFDDSIHYLGYYNNTVNIKIRLISYGNLDFDIGYIKKSDIWELNSNVKYEDNKYYVDSEDDKYLVLPINNIPGLHVYNNDVEVDTYKYLDNLLTVKVNKGKNVIQIRYKQPLFTLGLLLSIIGILLFIFNKRIKTSKIIQNICYYLYIFVIIGTIGYLYIYSFFKYL